MLWCDTPLFNARTIINNAIVVCIKYRKTLMALTFAILNINHVSCPCFSCLQFTQNFTETPWDQMWDRREQNVNDMNWWARYLHCHGASSLERRPRCRGREWRPGGRSAPGRGPGSWLGPFAVRSHTDTAAIQTMDTTYSDYQIHSLHSPTFAFLLLGKVKFEKW